VRLEGFHGDEYEGDVFWDVFWDVFVIYVRPLSK
jgi:trehalose/maltose hydrolase-like predicted phosphorylase